MKKSIGSKFSKLIFFSFLILIILRCTKEKTPLPPIPTEPTKWDSIHGDYKVYDTLGNFLYNLNIEHLKSAFFFLDSLNFTNIDGNFTVGAQQSIPDTGIYSHFFRIGHHSNLLDSIGNRWKMIEVGNLPYNSFKNDTILLKYRLTNINYYLEDITPYQDTIKIQIAVKQH